MLGDRPEERGHRLRGRRPPDRARRAGPCRVVEIAELVDRGLQLLPARRLRARRLLSACAVASRARRDRATQSNAADARGRECMRITRATGVLLSSFSASCR